MLARGIAANASAASARKRSAAGRQLRPASSIPDNATSALCETAPAQASAPAASAERGAPSAASSSRPSSQRRRLTGLGEQGLEPFVGLLATCRNDLRAREQADHQHEEEEVEAQGA